MNIEIKRNDLTQEDIKVIGTDYDKFNLSSLVNKHCI